MIFKSFNEISECNHEYNSFVISIEFDFNPENGLNYINTRLIFNKYIFEKRILISIFKIVFFFTQLVA